MADIDSLKRRSIEALAPTMGYIRDDVRSNAKSVTLKSATDRVVIKTAESGHSIYFSLNDDADHGSIIDFVMRRESLSYVDAVHYLEGKEISFPIVKSSPSPLPEVSATDYRKKVAAVWAAASWNPEPAYLLGRGLSREVLNDPRFRDTFRVSSKGVVVFPYMDRGQPRLCGYELRSSSLKAFGRGTKKGLWVSRNACTASTILVCEGPIDCFSHCSMHGGDFGYAAFGGGLGGRQRELLRGLLAKAANRGCEVVSGVDGDQAGVDYHDALEALAGRSLSRLFPISKDWNDDLLAGWCGR